MNVRVAGPAAWYLDVAAVPSAQAAAEIGALQQALLASAPAAVRDVVPGFTSLLVEFRPGASTRHLRRWLERAERTLERASLREPARHLVEVRYGDGADRAELEARLGLPWERIVELHSGADYTVAFLGFTPGFPYLLGLPRALATPRRETPRTRVPGGAVAIAGEHAGIYPSPSPGGWWILGRTDARPFDAGSWPPRAWAPGDAVRFVSVAAASDGNRGPAGAAGSRPGHGLSGSDGGTTAPATAGRPAHERGGRTPGRTPLGDPASRAVVEVLEAWPPAATLQAGPRWRVGHLGLAQAGALDPRALELANAALGNPPACAAVELLAQPLTLQALDTVTAALACGGHRARLAGRALDPGTAFAWPEGAVLELTPGGRAQGSASYLAVAGGLAAHRCGGSSSTDLRAGIGGGRRALQAGDLLGRGRCGGAGMRPAGAPFRPHYPQRLLLRLHPGPQFDPDVFAALTRSTFRVAGFDRTGLRLDGPAVDQGAPDVLSEGAPWGALQLPADGRPIVLLADRGRTGGYAKPAVVDVRDLWRLAQAPIGTEVWMAPAEAGTPSRRRPGEP